MSKIPTHRSRPPRSTTAGAHSTVGNCAPAVAAAVNPLRLPQHANAVIETALAPAREQGYRLWCETRRESIATLLLIALDQGWITAAAVQAAFAGPIPHEALYKLAGTAWQTLPGWLETLAQRHALHPNTTNSPIFAELDWQADGLESRWVLQLHTFWLHTFDLDALPPALACAIARTLELISYRLTECCLLREVAEMWMDESVMAYRSVQESGLSDVDALWAYVQEHTTLADEFGWEDQAGFAVWWDEIGAYCAPQTPWRRRWVQNHSPPPPRCLRGLVRRLWRWRRLGIADGPWFRWLRRAVLTLRRCERQWPASPGRTITLEADDSEPLGYGQLIGFDEGWEANFLDDFGQYLGSSGFGCTWHLRASVLEWEALRDTLKWVAIGQGLLIGASQANELS